MSTITGDAVIIYWRSHLEAKELLVKNKLPLILFLAAFISAVPLWAKDPVVPVLHQQTASAFPSVLSEGQPTSLSSHKQELDDYYYSGRYERDIAQVVNQATAFLEQHAGKHQKPAIVMDIDETALSNWIQMADNQFNYSPVKWNEWVLEAQAWAIGPCLNLFNTAKSLNVTVFFITGRKEAQRLATEQNLRNAGYMGWEKLFLKDKSYPYSATYKAARRKAIEELGYTILLNIGDQQSDLSGGFSLATYKLPNPFYLVK